MKKLIKWTLIIVPIVIILVVVVVLLRLDSIVKSTVESQATASTKLDTKLSGAHLSLLGGKVALSGLQIGSPQGFSSPEMFQMQDLKVAVNYSQLRQQPIRISEIVVEGPHLTLEQKGTSVNVKAAMDQMPKSEPSTMRLIIDTLQINSTKVTIKTELPFAGAKAFDLTLPSMTLKDIGNADGAQNGAAIKDVLQQVLAAVMEKTQQSQGIPADLNQWLNANAQGIQDQARSEVNKRLQDASGTLNKTTDEARKKLDQGLQDLLKQKK
jgi:uncharacterized protein involved in outer membrane biogenesis